MKDIALEVADVALQYLQTIELTADAIAPTDWRRRLLPISRLEDFTAEGVFVSIIPGLKESTTRGPARTTRAKTLAIQLAIEARCEAGDDERQAKLLALGQELADAMESFAWSNAATRADATAGYEVTDHKTVWRYDAASLRKAVFVQLREFTLAGQRRT